MSGQEQIRRKGGGGFGGGGGSAFELEEKINLPEIEGVMQQIDVSLQRTSGIVVRQKEPTMERGCGC